MHMLVIALKVVIVFFLFYSLCELYKFKVCLFFILSLIQLKVSGF